jgi:hypothetical protein
MTLTVQNPPAEPSTGPVASMQTSVPEDALIHSAGAGFLVHRTAQLKYEHAEEGMAFARELVEMLNAAQRGYATVLLFQEFAGLRSRVHWLLHLHNPDDYKRLLTMVDHSQKWREWAQLDRLPHKGGGAWDKVFVEGSISERVFCPQHGVGHAHDAPGSHSHDGHDGHDDHDTGTFQPPALHQSRVPLSALLHSANAGAIVHRTAKVRYETREQGRFYLFRWAERITEGLVGTASAFTYEEMWGVQDRLHALVHLTGPEAYQRVLEFEATDPQMRRIQQVEYAPGTPGEGRWPYMFLDGSFTDTMLVPVAGTHPRQ